LKNLLEHTGIEPGRLHFSWISSAEATKFAEVARGVISTVKETGPAQHFIKKQAEIA
jgi:F420-non-reducing hydrogenase iron-sulfur subunit